MVINSTDKPTTADNMAEMMPRLSDVRLEEEIWEENVIELASCVAQDKSNRRRVIPEAAV